jgi:hypothetical protein
MLFLSRFPLLWPSGLCTWGLRSRLYSGRPPLVYAPRNTCKNARFRSSSLQFPSPTHIPPCPLSCSYLSLSPSLPYSLRLYLVVLSRFLSCGSNSLYFCYAVRTPSLSHSVTQHTSLSHKPSSVPYLSSARLHCFGFFSLSLLVPSEKFAHPSWNFSRFQTHLILTPLRRVSVKIEN